MGDEYTVEYAVEGDILRITSSGRTTRYDSFFEKAQKDIKHILESGRKRILMDDRDYLLLIDVLDISLLSNALDDMDLPALGIRMAVVGHPDSLELYQTIETIFRNRSNNVLNFHDLDAAKEWLLA